MLYFTHIRFTTCYIQCAHSIQGNTIVETNGKMNEQDMLFTLVGMASQISKSTHTIKYVDCTRYNGIKSAITKMCTLRFECVHIQPWLS